MSVLALYGVALVYFAFGCTLSIEWVDEGQIIYPGWRVAQGAVPYRELQHLYGPSLFFLIGALFRLFGSDLLVIRIALVLLKALAAVLVYVGARRVAGRPFAFASYALIVALWGSPGWVFNTPYASHFGVTLTLLGAVAFLALRRRRSLLACVLAGLCCGVAATFKQTNGIFAFVALALFVLCEPFPWGSVELAPAASPLALRCLQWLRRLVLLGALGLFAAYVAPFIDGWTLFVVGGPIALTLSLLLLRELRGLMPSAQAEPRLVGVAGATLAFAVPIALYLVFYAAKGLLPELYYNLVSGLPQTLAWFVPFPAPGRRTWLLAIAIGAGLACVRVWRTTADARGARPKAWALAALAMSLVALVAVVGDIARAPGLIAYGRSGAWYNDVVRLFFFLPLAVMWGAFVPVGVRELRAPAEPAVAGAPVDQQSALTLWYFCALTSLLFLYPSADFWHIAMALPFFMPLLAYQLERVHRVEGPARGGRVSAVFIAGLLIAMGGPFVHSLAWARHQMTGPTHARARAIYGLQPKLADSVALIGHLEQRVAPGEGFFVIATEQMLYFLAGRPSVLERAEFVFYLVGMKLITAADARRLVPEPSIIARLQETKPVIVDYVTFAMSQRFRRMYPTVAQFIATHYRLDAEVGGYRILRWAGA